MADAQIKHWCETCEGTGKVYQEHQAGCWVGGEHPCPDCDGNGYWTPLAAPAVVVSAEPVAHVAAELLSQVAGTEFVMAMLCRQPHEYTVPLYATPVGSDAVDARDGERYRCFFEAGLPITFLGCEYSTKRELDAAIDAALASTRPSKGAA